MILRMDRRAALKGMASTITVGASTAILSGCTAAASRPQPTKASGAIEIGVAPDVGALLNNGTAAERAHLFKAVLSKFEEATPGVRVRYFPYMQGINTMAPAILSATGPDVFADCCVYGEYAERGLLMNLDSYLRRDNVNLGIWSPSQVHNFSTGHGTYALSRNVDSYAFAIRLDILDKLGIAYPSPNWTYKEFSALAAACTAPARAGRSTRFGVGYQNGYMDLLQIVPGFGGRTTNPSRTMEILSEAGGVEAGKWMFHELFWRGSATPSTSWSGSGAPNLGNGEVVIQEFQINQLLPSYSAWRSGFKWAFYPPPQYPTRRSNPVSDDFWGISATTKHPDQAWALAKWLATSAPFQRMMMKTFLFSPALNDLWAEWLHTIESTVPGLKGRNLHWFAVAAQKGWGVAQPYFRYGSTQAGVVQGSMWAQLLARRTSVTAAFKTADQQVNAIIKAAQTLQTQTAATAGLYPTVGPSVAKVLPGQ